MEKRATFLHGTDGSTDDHWFPWLKTEFESAGYVVFTPKLPNNHTPNRVTYDDFLKSSSWDFSNNVLVGHSSGATSILNLLAEDWFPYVSATVLVASFLNERLTKDADWTEKDQFSNLFPKDGFDLDAVSKKGGKFYVIHGDDDPYCSYEDAQELAQRLGATFVTVPNGHHLGGTSGVESLPGLISELRADGFV